MSDILNYYKEPGLITRLDKYKYFTDWLTDNPNAICQVVQGLLLHDSWVSMYGEDYIKSHEYGQKTAYMEDILDKALELDTSNFSIPRPPRNRVIACCREFATLTCAMLRAKGIPARSRCGFAAYFGWNGQYEDHWICEYWHGNRWIMTDPQLDPFQESMIIEWSVQRNKNFNPRDLMSDEFIPAGLAWKLCRDGKIEENRFGIGCPIKPEWGIHSLHGLWFVRGQLLRDFAALNKIETVPYLVRISKGLDWKPWRLIDKKDEELTEQDLLLLDTIAELSIKADDHMNEIWDMYEANHELRVPAEIIMKG